MSFVSSTLHLMKTGGRPTAGRLSRWRAMSNRILARSEQLSSLSDAELLKQAGELSWQAKTGTPLKTILPEAYALARDASRRALGMQHYLVQLIGGIALFEGNIAEMQTGEGKTLTAVLPAFLRAIMGKGCHVITVNDYLAQRDAETMGKVYRLLGLSTGCIQTPMETDERREEYAKDITYGTAKEMGFDFLRDRLRMGASGGDTVTRRSSNGAGGEAPVQRGHYFSLVDEADSILIDEARTPLIIGLTMPNDAASVNLLRWGQRATHHLEINKDFLYEPDKRSAFLTDDGCRRVLLMGKPSLIDTIDTERIYKSVEQALTSRFAFERDRDYVVVDDKIVIVDESTGRMMDGRKWQDGLHQSVEAKELVPITAGTGQAAKITVQNFFRQYTFLAGMTGTAVQSRRELKKSYEVKVTPIPTNQPCIRAGLPSRVFSTMNAKWNAVVEDVERLVGEQRSILLGTPSVDASEALGELLKKKNIKHQILNAKFHEMEADIISKAGEPGKVTIATNMAGRGTDILLKDNVVRAGGLHVIATEMHSSKRIDRQLVGRAARQGDPGSFQFYLSMEDELLRCLTAEKRTRLKSRAGDGRKAEIGRNWLKLFPKTQRYLEKMHRKQRKSMLKQEKQKLELYEKMGLDPFLELTE